MLYSEKILCFPMGFDCNLRRTVRYGTQRAMDSAPATISEFSPRQQQVLGNVLDLMVEEGDAFSMASVARRAACSKETLYKWFGDREGLLTATVRWQAAKVRMPALAREGLTRERLEQALFAFAQSWLTVITGDVSVALNRLAISHAGSQKSGLGRIVLENGPNAMARRLEPLFSMGMEAGLLRRAGQEELFSAFFGLVVADAQIRALLGGSARPGPQEIEVRAAQAAQRFLALHGAQEDSR
jgi:AcrR family transcriptional regulator